MAQSRIEQLKAILAQDPAINSRVTLWAWSTQAREKVDAALAEFQQLLVADPHYANAYFMAAQALAGAERKEEARQMLKDGIAAAQRSGNQHAQSEMQQMLDEL